jgi:hypothetical protein
MANLPQLTDEQRDAARAKAAEARRVRAEVKNLLKMGSLSLADLFERTKRDDVVAKMKVVQAIESLPGVGKVKARRAMEEVGIADTRRLRGLGEQQRARLLEMFP